MGIGFLQGTCLVRLQNLYLRNFRNYSSLELELNAGLTIFTGNNGQGKTNVLESIGLSSALRSFRTMETRDLIRWERPRAELLFGFEEEDFGHAEILITLDRSRGKSVAVDGDIAHQKYRVALRFAFEGALDAKNARRSWSDAVDGLHPNSMEEALGDDPGFGGIDLGSYGVDRNDFLAREIHDRLENAELIVCATAVAQVDQDATALRQHGFVLGVCDARADDAIAEHPIPESADRVRAARS